MHRVEYTVSAPPLQLGRWGKAPRLLGWHEIRDTLLEALPPHTVHFEQPVLSYQPTDSSVIVEFIEDVAPVEAKVLIGADGWCVHVAVVLFDIRTSMCCPFSTTRHTCCRFSYTRFQALHDALPEFQQRVFWRARIPWREGLPKDHTVWFVEGDRATTRFGCIIPVSAKEVVWQASAPAAALKAARLKLELQATPSPSAQGDKSFHRDPKTVRMVTPAAADHTAHSGASRCLVTFAGPLAT